MKIRTKTIQRGDETREINEKGTKEIKGLKDRHN